MTTTPHVSDVEYAIREAQWHLEQASQILQEARADPARYRNETTEQYRLLAPWIALMIHSRFQSSGTQDSSSQN